MCACSMKIGNIFPCTNPEAGWPPQVAPDNVGVGDNSANHHHHNASTTVTAAAAVDESEEGGNGDGDGDRRRSTSLCRLGDTGTQPWGVSLALALILRKSRAIVESCQ